MILYEILMLILYRQLRIRIYARQTRISQNCQKEVTVTRRRSYIFCFISSKNLIALE